MATISLTQQDTGLVFQLEEFQIEQIRTDAGGSYVERGDPHGNGFNGGPLFVTQTPAQIAAQCESMIPLNISKDAVSFTAVYLNAMGNHFGSVQAAPASITTASGLFEYFHNGNTMEMYYSVETPAQIATLLQQTHNSTKNPFPGAITFGGAGATLTAAIASSGYVQANCTVPGTLTLDTPANFAAQLGITQNPAGATFIMIIHNTGIANATLALGAGFVNSTAAPVSLGAGALVAGGTYAYQMIFTTAGIAYIAQSV
jgi:hypothetical protein